VFTPLKSDTTGKSSPSPTQLGHKNPFDCEENRTEGITRGKREKKVSIFTGRGRGARESKKKTN
jgi:hypothetical protein